MPVPTLHSIQEAVDKADAALRGGRKALSFTGRFGAGKTTALDELESRLDSRGTPTVRVSLPFGDDSAFIALAILSDRLTALGKPADASARDTTRSFGDRLDALLELIPEEAVVLFDEPRLDSKRLIDETIFDWRALEFSQRILAARRDKPVVITSRAAETAPGQRPFRIQVERAASPREVLAAASLLDQPSVAQLLAQKEAVLSRCSPIEIRLAAAAARGGQLNRVLRSNFDLTGLLDIATAQVTPAMRQALGRLSLVRGLIDALAFDWGTTGLSEVERALVKTVFLFGNEGGLRLHESIAILAARENWLSQAGRQAAHRELADRYRRGFSIRTAAQAVEGAAFRQDMECIHHRTLAADATLLDDTVFFAEQYDMVGRVFGTRGRALYATDRPAAREAMRFAVRAYEQALRHEPDDWYAEHYRAFNLDALGDDVRVIGPAYERVTSELNPGFVWGHSRYVRWLITCGRLKEASNAFARAERELLGEPSPGDARLYEEFHVDIARQALENGQHLFAARVLDKVPEQVRSELSRYDELRQWAAHQAEIEEGEIVFPSTVVVEHRWVRPVLAQPDEVVERYWPGVVTAQEGQTWKFRVGFEPGAFGWRTLEATELKELGFDSSLKPLPVGTYGEFITVGGRERLETHQPQGFAFEKQRVRFPDPRRYLRDEQG